MVITISGENDKLTKIETVEAVEFYSSLLLSPRLSKHIDLEIIFTDDLKFKGLCSYLDSHRKPREFEISLDNRLGKRSQLLTLAHEMVHLKQFAKGELRDVRDVASKSWKQVWNGQALSEESTDYYDLPWEIEAYGREIGMYRRFMDSRSKSRP